MHKLLYILCFCLGLLLQTQAQQLLERFNKISGTGETYSELAVLDSGFVTMVQDYYNWDALVVREYDTKGDLVDSVHYDFGEFVDNNGDNLIPVPGSSDFILALTKRHALLLVHFNRQWDTLYTQAYQFQDTVQTNIFSLKLDQDTNLVMTGYAFRRDLSRSSIITLKFDTSFNLIWEKQINDPLSDKGGYQGLNILPIDSGYLVGGVASYFTQEPNKGVYALIDNQGNLKWQRIVHKGLSTSGLHIAPRTDGNFFYVGYYEIDTTVSGVFDIQQMIYGQFDIQGNPAQEKELGPIMTEIRGGAFTKLTNGHYVIGGSTFQQGRPLGQLLCFDEDGNEIWHHRYFYAYERETCFLETIKPAGSGLIGVGEVYDFDRRFSQPGQKFQWLLSVDENGCLNPDSCGQWFDTPEPEPLHAFELFPQPAQDYMQLHWNSQSLHGQALQVRLISSDGRALQKLTANGEAGRIEVNTAALPAGLYVLEVLSENQLLHRTKVLVQH
jgi:hypothetical protein